MATRKDEAVTPESVTSEEMVAAAKASATAATEKRNNPGRLRRKGGGLGRDLRPSDIPYPEGLHGDDYEKYSAVGSAAVIPTGTDISPYTEEQEFELDEDKVRVLYFDRPGRNLPKKRLYNIKGIHEDGRFVQIAFETTIENFVGGDAQDAIPLRRAQRKGIHLLLHDWETLRPIYCGAWDCWAKASESGNYVGFCTLKHAQHTKPNLYKGSSEISQGLMERGVTTTNVWGSA